MEPVTYRKEWNENGVFQPIKDGKPEQDEEEQDMDILQQCQKWNENDEYQKIIDALEAIPAKERTPEMKIRRSSSTGVRKAFPCLNF